MNWWINNVISFQRKAEMVSKEWATALISPDFWFDQPVCMDWHWMPLSLPCKAWTKCFNFGCTKDTLVQKTPWLVEKGRAEKLSTWYHLIILIVFFSLGKKTLERKQVESSAWYLKQHPRRNGCEYPLALRKKTVQRLLIFRLHGLSRELVECW